MKTNGSFFAILFNAQIKLFRAFNNEDSTMQQLHIFTLVQFHATTPKILHEIIANEKLLPGL